jgi:hypothetical protein
VPLVRPAGLVAVEGVARRGTVWLVFPPIPGLPVEWLNRSEAGPAGKPIAQEAGCCVPAGSADGVDTFRAGGPLAAYTGPWQGVNMGEHCWRAIAIRRTIERIVDKTVNNEYD